MNPSENTDVRLKGAVQLPYKTTVGGIADVLGKTVIETIKELMRMGYMMGVNEEVDLNLGMQLAAKWNIPIKKPEERTSRLSKQEREGGDKSEDLVDKIPVITVVGHVDHGKTTLLDQIRKTSTADREAGGITQSIGASQVEYSGRSLTFIDTPGHEVFTAMRANGIQVTDVVLLVVAADDGVMPQTIEAIDHVKAAGVPIVVAFNKTDLAGADVDAAKFQLAEHGLVLEELGGNVQGVNVSARDGKGIDELMEALLLLIDVEEFKSNPNAPGKGAVIESTVDPQKGTLATILLRTGTLKQGDTVVVGSNYGRVRAMFDFRSKPIKSVMPGQPAQFIGLNKVPDAGENVEVVDNDLAARELTTVRKNLESRRGNNARSTTMADIRSSKQLEDDTRMLNVIVKAKTAGAVDAARQALETNQTSDVGIRIVHAGVGAVNESDIMLAAASDGLVAAFDLKLSSGVVKQARKLNVVVKTYNVIYQLIEDISENFRNLLSPVTREVIEGTAIVLQIFPYGRNRTISGIRVTKGTVHKSMRVRIKRDGKEIYDGTISSMRHVKSTVSSLKEGVEGGLAFADFNDTKQDDTLECYQISSE